MSALSPASLANAAAEAFRSRQAKAAEQVRNRGLSRGQAEAALRPWLAIACLCGADLPELGELLAERIEKRTDGSWNFTPDQARGAVALDICPRARMIDVLTRARDAALDALPVQGDPNSPQFEAASGLNRIANHLGCKAYIPGCTAAQRRAA